VRPLALGRRAERLGEEPDFVSEQTHVGDRLRGAAHGGRLARLLDEAALGLVRDLVRREVGDHDVGLEGGDLLPACLSQKIVDHGARDAGVHDFDVGVLLSELSLEPRRPSRENEAR
jgi:hypothetical protein